MAVDDTGRGWEQGGNATQGCFKPLHLCRGQPLQPVDAVFPGGFGNALDPRDFRVFCSDNQLADLGIRNPALAAIPMQALTPGNAAAGFQPTCRIAKTAMNYLAVARGSLKPDRIGTFGDEHFPPGQCQRPGRRKPDHPAPITAHSISSNSPPESSAMIRGPRSTSFVDCSHSRGKRSVAASV